MAIEWYVSTRDGERGPFSGAELKQWAAEGWLKPDMFIKRGAEGKWAPARQVKGLVFAEKPSPGPVRLPPPPPPPRSKGPVEPGVGASDEAAAEPFSDPGAATGFPQIRIETTESDAAADRRGPSGPRRSLIQDRTFRQGVLIAGGVLAAALVVVGVFLFLSSRPPAGPPVAEGPAGTPSKELRSGEEPIPVTSETEPDGSQAILELDWPDEEREGAAVDIDLKKAELPASGELRYALEPGKHRVDVRRRGYVPDGFSREFTAGETHVHKVELKEVGDPKTVPEKFDQWIERFAGAQSDPDEADRVVSQFNEDPWVESYAAEDPGAAARLHLEAAVLLFRTGLHERVSEQCQAGLACKPADPESQLWQVETEFWLVLFHELCRQVRPRGERIVGTGTGFCVAEGGYVLTNHHVIDVAEKIKVQLAGHGDLVPAELTAADPGADIALLKVGLPAEVDLAPIPIATTAAQLGQEVCLLGYPFTGTNENTLKVVRGIVSSLPAGPGGGIEIDSPVNPGNSGGPLFSYRGDVLGMVTEKIFSFDPAVTPLGRAIPAQRLRRFLDAALRKEGTEPVAAKATDTLSAQELAGRFGPSVVLILSIR